MSTFRPSTLSPTEGSVRQSPFRRQNSHSPAPPLQPSQHASPPISPPKTSHFSPTRPSSLSLSPEKTSPFVRRPSTNSTPASRPVSPFARPSSGLKTGGEGPGSPRLGGGGERKASVRSGSDASAETVHDAPPVATPREEPTPVQEDTTHEESEEELPAPFSPALASPLNLDGQRSPAFPSSPSAPRPSQANLRPAAQRTVTSSTVETIRPPTFAPTAAKSTIHAPPATQRSYAALKPPTATGTTFVAGGATGHYSSLPPPLLSALRASFSVLDTSSSGQITPHTLPQILSDLGLPSSPHPYFPPSAPQSHTLATYLAALSSPLSQLSPPEELMAAFAAFDSDDSGQIDARELSEALQRTGPENYGEEDNRLSQDEVGRAMEGFVGRRAFGGKGQGGFGGGGRGEVFRYREFVERLAGGGGDAVIDAGEGLAA